MAGSTNRSSRTAALHRSRPRTVQHWGVEVVRLEVFGHSRATVRSRTKHPEARARVFVVITDGEGVWARGTDGERVPVEPPCLLIFERGEADYGADIRMEERYFQESTQGA